jgi:hypothetical protein
MPPCQLPGYEQYVYTGFQLPYDPHEWDYNSWYDVSHPGRPAAAWYYEASRRQRERHSYQQVRACGQCALREICDGFHAQYATRWGGGEAAPYPGPPVTDPRHFIQYQDKNQYLTPEQGPVSGSHPPTAVGPTTPLGVSAGGGAVARHKLPAG